MLLANSGSASDSVHRQSWWTFSFATETGTHSGPDSAEFVEILQFWTRLLVCRWCAETVEAPQLQFIDSLVHVPAVMQRLVPTGAACQPGRLLEEFPLLPCRVVRTWKTGHFYFALVPFSLFWRLGVACGVQRIGFFGRSCVHLTWFDSGYVFVGKNLHIFYVAVNSNPEAFALQSCRM